MKYAVAYTEYPELIWHLRAERYDSPEPAFAVAERLEKIHRNTTYFVVVIEP